MAASGADDLVTPGVTAAECKHFRKRIVVCCDGTWQSSVSGQYNIPSNVTRMVRHLADYEIKDEVDGLTMWKQVVHYDEGIGTGNLSKLDTIRQGGTGAGLSHNVINCYNFVVTNYTPGDKIYCFGFSRGAYTARSLVGLINRVGVCSKLDMQAFPYIYTKYEACLPKHPGESADDKKAREEFDGIRDSKGDYVRDASGKPVDAGICRKWMNPSDGQIDITLGDKSLLGQWVYKSRIDRKPIDNSTRVVEVCGVWDTVGSLGVPKIFGWLNLPFQFGLGAPGRQFHDVGLSKYTNHAFHALALDERRYPFSPTLWYEPPEEIRRPDQSFKQCWFPGVHTSVGGGSDDILEEKRRDFETSANIAFSWMVEQVRPFLAFDADSFKQAIAEQNTLLQQLGQEDLPYPKSGLRQIAAFFRRVWCRLTGKPYPKVDVIENWSCGNFVDSYSFLDDPATWLGWHKRRAPMETFTPEAIWSEREVPTRTLGQTKESIHPCVWYRMKTLHRCSKSLVGWRREQSGKSGWVWKKESTDFKSGKTVTLELPEHRIMSTSSSSDGGPNLERMTAEAYQATDYMLLLDKHHKTGKDETGEFEVFTVGL